MAERARNIHSDLFEAAFADYQHVAEPVPYFRQKHDFIQLQALIDKGKEHDWEITAERWQIALDHYFSSELACYPSIAHLCSRFSAFYRSSLNQYGQPLGKAQSKNGEAVQMMRERYGRQQTDSNRGDSTESKNSLRVINGGRR